MLPSTHSGRFELSKLVDSNTGAVFRNRSQHIQYFLENDGVRDNLYLIDLDFEGAFDEPTFAQHLPTFIAQNIAKHLSTSIAQNKSIEYLSCSFGLFDYGPAILCGLAQHTRIQTIELHSSDTTLELTSALSAVIKSSTAPLECLKFGPMRFREEWFSVVAPEIRVSQSVIQIVLKGTTLDEGSTRMLQGLLTAPTRKRYSLTLAVNTRFSNATETFMKEVLQSNTCCVPKLKLEGKRVPQSHSTIFVSFSFGFRR